MTSKIDPNEICIDANIPQGLRRTNADKRKAVRLALLHPYSRAWSDRLIGKHVGVDHVTVGRVRRELERRNNDQQN